MCEHTVGSIEPSLANQLVVDVGYNISERAVALLLHESCEVEHFLQEIFAVGATAIVSSEMNRHFSVNCCRDIFLTISTSGGFGWCSTESNELIILCKVLDRRTGEPSANVGTAPDEAPARPSERWWNHPFRGLGRWQCASALSGSCPCFRLKRAGRHLSCSKWFGSLLSPGFRDEFGSLSTAHLSHLHTHTHTIDIITLIHYIQL